MQACFLLGLADGAVGRKGQERVEGCSAQGGVGSPQWKAQQGKVPEGDWSRRNIWEAGASSRKGHADMVC